MPDHLGSASIVTDDKGKVIEASVYYPYGMDRARSGSFESAWIFIPIKMVSDASQTVRDCNFLILSSKFTTVSSTSLCVKLPEDMCELTFAFLSLDVMCDAPSDLYRP